MDESTGQLLSTRINNLAGEAAGHNNETAHNEITFDNPIDVDASDVKMLISEANSAFAILDNGPGIENIWHLLGEGDGLKIKTGGKIGSKIAGELASGTFFQADRTLYFSRCNQNSISRKHQQLNVAYNKMVSTVKIPDMDMNTANQIFYKRDRLVRKPESDNDKFDTDNVVDVKALFNNNEHIVRYFDDVSVTGMLKVFKYEPENKARFLQMVSEMPKILSKAEFITYNTLAGFSGNRTFQYIDVDRYITEEIDSSSCKQNFILGRDSLIYEPEEEFDEDSFNEQIVKYDETFGIMSKKVLSISNRFYEKDGKIYNKCSIDNFGEEFVIGTEGKVMRLNSVSNASILSTISDEDNLIGEIPMYMSFVDIDEAGQQRDLMNEASTLESMKQVYVYYNGRYLARDKLINIIAGFQERSLPHFRIALGINENTTQYLNIRAQKSSISLSKAHPLIPKTIIEVIKPIISKLYVKHNSMIQNGIDNWDDYRDDVLSLINNGTTAVKVPNPVPNPAPNPVPNPAPNPAPNPIYVSLNTDQTILHLNRLKTMLNLGQKYRSKGEKKKIITVLNNIERELILDDDMMNDKINNLIQLLRKAEHPANVLIKKSSELQEL
jgi:hypothetical protein